MTTYLGSSYQVRRIVGLSSNDLSDDEIIARLQESDNLLRSKHFASYMEDQQPVLNIGRNQGIRRAYESYSPIKANSTVAVMLNGVALTSTTDYSVSGNIITIATSVQMFENDQLVFKYIPDFFDDYCSYIAARRILDSGMIDTSANSSMSQIRANVKEQIQEYERIVAAKPYVGRWKDHYQNWNEIY